MKRDKEVRTDVLIKILLNLPEGSIVRPNSVGQLIVDGPDDEMLGYIDLQLESFVSAD